MRQPGAAGCGGAAGRQSKPMAAADAGDGGSRAPASGSCAQPGRQPSDAAEPGACVRSAAARPGAGNGNTRSVAAAHAPEGSVALGSSAAAMPATGHVTCELDAEDIAQRGCIRDALGDLTFRISPSAFYQARRPVHCLPCPVSGLLLCWALAAAHRCVKACSRVRLLDR